MGGRLAVGWGQKPAICGTSRHGRATCSTLAVQWKDRMKIYQEPKTLVCSETEWGPQKSCACGVDGQNCGIGREEKTGILTMSYWKTCDHPTTYSQAYTREGQDGTERELPRLGRSQNPAILRDQEVLA
jgi:hypothetical protein